MKAKKENRGNPLITLSFFVVCFFYYNNFIPFVVWNISFYFFFACVIMYYTIKKVWDRRVVLIISIVLLLGIICSYHNGTHNIVIVLKTVMYILLADNLAKSSLDKKMCELYVYFCFAVLFVAIFTCGNINTYFPSLSRNYFSIIFLPSIIFYYSCIDNQIKNNEISLLPVGLYLCISILAIGRTGIIVSMLLFMSIAVIKFLRNGAKKNIIYVVLAMSIIFVLYLNISLFVPYFERLQELGLSNDGRSLIWEKYLKIVTSTKEDLFFSPNIQKIALFKQFDYNFHNSFFQMHHQYGLLFMIGYLMMFVQFIILCLKNKKHIIMVCGIMFMLRAFFDQMGYAFFTEIFFYYFILYRNKKDEFICNKSNKRLLRIKI